MEFWLEMFKDVGFPAAVAFYLVRSLVSTQNKLMAGMDLAAKKTDEKLERIAEDLHDLRDVVHDHIIKEQILDEMKIKRTRGG